MTIVRLKGEGISCQLFVQRERRSHVNFLSKGEGALS